MGAADELRDPAGLILAGASVTAALLADLPAPAAVAVGAAVLTAKAVTAGMLDRRGASRPGPAPAGPIRAAAGGYDHRPGREPLDQEAAAVPTPVPVAPTESATGPVFRPEGEYWTIGYRGTTFRLRDAKGLRYLHRLLGDPGREFHAMDLAGSLGPSAGISRASPRAADDLHVGGTAGAGPLLDAQAKAAYRRRLDHLRDEAEEARAWGDGERADRAEVEIAALAQELARAVGLDGKDRTAVSASERARVNVTRAVKAAIERITEHDRSLGHHLRATVRTGTFCSYVPAPEDHPPWQI